MSFMWLVLFFCFLQLCAGAQDLKTQFLSPHNDARSQVGIAPLVWDDTVAAYAQNYGKQCKADCALQHSSGSYGENIFWGKGKELSPVDAVNAWVEEKQYYSYNSNSCAQGQQCGHYTQVMWKNSQKVGCARVKCNDGAIFITCDYDPPGNYVGEKTY
ncbi:pathogenesis-related protein 1C-like [Cryptomeria japonica]|uniref:pathogenesis-related protein 1C-like n=1 Tax=Cryptomeria japonica TaxID=3369 RepID=UPI0027DA466D|nr:pathogenesis-related protein 1C-like [Cryptomeria japonica]